MIIVKLMGGLGNQMFQYATARRVAHAKGAILKLDVTWFDNNADTPRQYMLNRLCIKEEIASNAEIEAFFPRTFLRRTWKRLTGYIHKQVYQEQSLFFQPGILTAPAHAYLAGYWQSEKYFNDIRHILIKEFMLRESLSGKNLELCELILSCTSVGLHVRRGDMAANPETLRYHGICSPDYYIRCIEHIASRNDKPHIFIFSDDISWVRDNIKTPHPTTLIDNNGIDNSHFDLLLLSKCKHIIMANSSFSWWAAWLNENPDTIVIAPMQYYADERRNATLVDLIPPRWTLL